MPGAWHTTADDTRKWLTACTLFYAGLKVYKLLQEVTSLVICATVPVADINFHP
jgi:hypothetical protein